MPRLLVLASTYPRWIGDREPGFVHELSRRLVDRFRVTVICPHAQGAARREVMDGVEVVRFRYAPERFERLVNDGGIVSNLRKRPWTRLLVPLFVLSQAFALAVEARRRGVDVVHAHWLVPQGFLVALLQAMRVVRAPFVVTSHGGDLFALRGKLMGAVKRYVIHRAAAVTVVSEGMREALNDIGVAPDLARVEPMGVDLVGRFSPDPGIERSRNQLLFVGRIVEKKGLMHLIEALPKVRAVRPDIELVVAGFGPEEATCRRRVKELGLDDCVRFEGAVEQAALPGYYRRAALFVAPFVEAATGDQDGLGLVTIEALGCGCPVVVSDMPATRGLIGLGGPIYPATSGDEESLAIAILSALSNPPGPRIDLSWFDWGTRAKAYSAVLTLAMGCERDRA